MQDKFDYHDVTSKALDFLKNRLLYKYVTIRHYRSRWLFIKEYMESRKIDFISSAVCNDFLINLYNGHEHRNLSVNEKNVEKAVSVLSEFIATGTIQKKNKITHLDGPIGILMKDFLAFKVSLRRSKLTIDKIETHMSNFNFWLLSNGVSNIHDIKQIHINNFIKSLDPNKKALLHDTLMDLGGFFNYLYKKEIISVNMVSFIPKDNYVRQSQLPSYYTEEEIDKLLKAIDRGTAVGKRDYTILLIAARLGLRASDIARLKFENLHWENSIIVLNQYKTGKNLTLPLLPAIGNAILDYIQYGRPKSDEKNIFLLAVSPFIPTTSRSISTMVQRRFIDSNINIVKRRHGAHALRHSLVKELLNNKQALPVITEVLGHSNTESARHYIRIDTESLRQCALDVPMVDPLFYLQGEEDYFYE
jgi:site-specific recombinase XerD